MTTRVFEDIEVPGGSVTFTFYQGSNAIDDPASIEDITIKVHNKQEFLDNCIVDNDEEE